MVFFSFINPLKWNYTWRLYKCLFQLSWRGCYCIIVIRNLCTKLFDHSLYHLSGIAFGDVFLQFFFFCGRAGDDTDEHNGTCSFVVE